MYSHVTTDTFVSRVISKTQYSHFRTHSISIVEKYKQANRNYKWEEISFSKLICDSKSQCSHMWVHWLQNCAITFNLHDKLFYSAATIVVFNNGHCAQKKAYFCFIGRQVKHKTVDNFGTNRDISMKFFVVDPHNYGVEWWIITKIRDLHQKNW